MNAVIMTKSYKEPPFCEREILRYAGCKSSDDELLQLLRTCMDEVREKMAYKVCYQELPVSTTNGTCDFECLTVKSQDLAKNLQGCKTAVVFAATLGVEIDRLIAKYGRISPSKALILQAIGAERIEALCDAFCEDIAKEKDVVLKPRFSPGYGDLPIEVQKDIFRILDCSKRIGLSLNNSLLMSPSKSVTAFVGLAESAENANRTESAKNTETASSTEFEKTTVTTSNTQSAKNTVTTSNTIFKKTTKTAGGTESAKTTVTTSNTMFGKTTVTTSSTEFEKTTKTINFTEVTNRKANQNKCTACAKTDCEYRGIL